MTHHKKKGVEFISTKLEMEKQKLQCIPQEYKGS